jgi:hypothetical protein
VLALLALGLALLTAHEIMLVVIAYGYMASGLVMWGWARLHRHSHEGHEGEVAAKNTKASF